MAGEGFDTEQGGGSGSHDPSLAAREAADKIATQVREILTTAEQRAREIRDRAERDAEATREESARAAARMLQRLDELESRVDGFLSEFFGTVREEAHKLASREKIEAAQSAMPAPAAPTERATATETETRPEPVPPPRPPAAAPVQQPPSPPEPPRAPEPRPTPPPQPPPAVTPVQPPSPPQPPPAVTPVQPPSPPKPPPSPRAQPEQPPQVEPVPHREEQPAEEEDHRKRRGFIWGRREREDDTATQRPPGDPEDAHVMALNMALNGTPREETETYLTQHFDNIEDLESILDDVYGRVKRR